MFKFSPLHGDIRILYAGRVQLGLRLGDVGSWSYAPFEAILRKLEVVGVGLHRVVEKAFLSIGAAQLEIVHGEFRLQTELCGLVVGSRRLCLFPSGGNDATD